MAYSYDSDGRWYLITADWPIHVKAPLELAVNNRNFVNSDETFLKNLERTVAAWILTEYPRRDPEFKTLLDEAMSDARLKEKGWDLGRGKLVEAITESGYPLDRLARDLGGVLEYFDDWAVIVPDNEYREVKKVLLRKASRPHVETIRWEGHPLPRLDPEKFPRPYTNPYIEDVCFLHIAMWLRNRIRACDELDNTGADLREALSDEEIARTREDCDLRDIAPEWFIHMFREIMDNREEAAELIKTHKNQLMQEAAQFGSIYRMSRETGERAFRGFMKDGDAEWLNKAYGGRIL